MTSISIISHLVALPNIASGNFVIIITKTHMVTCTCIQGQIALTFVTILLSTGSSNGKNDNNKYCVIIQSVVRITYSFFIVLFYFYFLSLYIATVLDFIACLYYFILDNIYHQWMYIQNNFSILLLSDAVNCATARPCYLRRKPYIDPGFCYFSNYPEILKNNL